MKLTLALLTIDLGFRFHVSATSVSSIFITWVKVTVYLQRCLQSYACSSSQFRRRYPKPYIKLKLIELAI